MQITTQTLTLEVAEQRVSAALLHPDEARVGFVLAHGAGAGMHHPSMATLANELAALGIATLRYQFPYMERGSKRPDPPALCHATVRAAVAAAARHLPEVMLIAGGRSFGGRMTSQAQALTPLPGVRGLAFFGFPLHPAGKPGRERAAHLPAITLPMLFIQGTQDALASPALLEPVIAELGTRATLLLLPQADHSLHVPRRSGRTDAQVRGEALATFVSWSMQLLVAD